MSSLSLYFFQILYSDPNKKQIVSKKYFVFVLWIKRFSRRARKNYSDGSNQTTSTSCKRTQSNFSILMDKVSSSKSQTTIKCAPGFYLALTCMENDMKCCLIWLIVKQWTWCKHERVSPKQLCHVQHIYMSMEEYNRALKG